LWLGYGIGQSQLWMLIKLALVLVLVAYHAACGVQLAAFRENRNSRSHLWFRWFNEAPVLLLVAVVILVVVKPF
jgi:putative membrane protein